MQKHPWKQYILSIPPQTLDKIKSFNIDSFCASCVKRLKVEDIQNGVYQHIGIEWKDEKLSFKANVLPKSTNGRSSSKNLYGYEKTYKDLPKVKKEWSIDVPNYGDWSNGSHAINFEKDVYKKVFFPQKLLSINIELFGEDVIKGAYVFKFAVDEVLDRKELNFEESLLFDLNLLQENIGNFDVASSNASVDDYLKTLYINWEILPPGEKEDMVSRILSGSSKSDDPKIRSQVADRYVFLQGMKPIQYIKGTSEFRRYFGAKFANDLVVFENIEYGNAVYIMFGDWEELSKKSRTELLSSAADNFIRIPHQRTWKLKIKKIIDLEMTKRKSPQKG